jgi:hypothetical protein
VRLAGDVVDRGRLVVLDRHRVRERDQDATPAVTVVDRRVVRGIEDPAGGCVHVGRAVVAGAGSVREVTAGTGTNGRAQLSP